MSRNLVALGAFVLVGGLMWLVTQWPAARDDASVPVTLEAPPPASPAPQPTAAGGPASAAVAPAAPAAEPEPEPAEPEPPPEPARPLQVRALPEQITGDQGPVDEYRKQFESEPRASNANALESEVRGAWLASDGAPDLIKSVLCRQSICRMEMRWSQTRIRAYIVGFTRLQKRVQIPVALSPVGPKNAEGVQLVEVYIKLKPPGAVVIPEH